tara:strand:- start:258 stop:431 length:174 start_codon:yes stop_codon:yes gene_type:complete
MNKQDKEYWADLNQKLDVIEKHIARVKHSQLLHDASKNRTPYVTYLLLLIVIVILLV